MSQAFNIQQFIRRQRDGEDLPDEDIVRFIMAITDGTACDAHIAAFTMASYLCGIGGGEVVTLTKALRDSGEVLTWDLDGPILDSHSTGGVGDMSSIALAPMIAACGGFVPMISGRGIGHAGGTLDKLDSIPGYQTHPDIKKFRSAVTDIGCAIIGQTDQLTPADARIYAVRDITATIESKGLITASLLSKKLAAGVKGLVLDVKTGNGAFIPSFGEAKKLASLLTDVARACNLSSSALITDMSQPLASCAGNSLEIRETIDYLKGNNPNPRLNKVIMALGAELLYHGDLARNEEKAHQLLQESISSGKAAEIFSKMVAHMGGPSDLLENPDKHLPHAAVIKPVPAPTSGFIHAINTRLLGQAVSDLGGGRINTDDKIDYSVGLSEISKVADKLVEGSPLLTLHAPDLDSWDRAAAIVQQAYSIEGISISPNDEILDSMRPKKFR